jgi:hypothetical protein
LLQRIFQVAKTHAAAADKGEHQFIVGSDFGLGCFCNQRRTAIPARLVAANSFEELAKKSRRVDISKLLLKMCNSN